MLKRVRSTDVGWLSAAPGTVPLVLVAMLVSGVAAPAVLAKPGHRDCGGTTITGAFADSCRDFTAHSRRSISYVELHYVDGRVARHRYINSRDWAIDGEPGDEIDLAKVKSGTTIEEFACVPTNTAPTALLEIQTPPIDQTLETCYDFFAGGLACEQSSPRTAWTSPSQIPDNGGSESGFFHWGCGGLSDSSLCRLTVSFRGIGSSDPDGDIGSWSLDFGDGTSASGSWSAPPTEVTHEYALGGTTCTGVVGSNRHVCIVTLTVTDSVGQSDSDAILMVFVDQTPD